MEQNTNAQKRTENHDYSLDVYIDCDVYPDLARAERAIDLVLDTINHGFKVKGVADCVFDTYSVVDNSAVKTCELDDDFKDRDGKHADFVCLVFSFTTDAVTDENHFIRCVDALATLPVFNGFWVERGYIDTFLAYEN